MRDGLTNEFYWLGIRDVFPVSAEHGIGVDALLDHVTESFSRDESPAEEPEAPPGIKVAIIGRPNVGKSTLLNALTGKDRAIVSPIAGTTRDAVDEDRHPRGHRVHFRRHRRHPPQGQDHAIWRKS